MSYGVSECLSLFSCRNKALCIKKTKMRIYSIIIWWHSCLKTATPPQNWTSCLILSTAGCWSLGLLSFWSGILLSCSLISYYLLVHIQSEALHLVTIEARFGFRKAKLIKKKLPLDWAEVKICLAEFSKISFKTGSTVCILSTRKYFFYINNLLLR